MTVNLNQLVNVTSSVQDSVLKAANFGIIAVFTDTTNHVGWIDYSADADGLAAMAAAGFGTYHGAYQAAIALANASPGVSTFRVYARENPDAESYTLTPTITKDGYVYSFTVNGIEIEHTNDGDGVDDICVSLQAQIDAVAGVSCTDNTTDLTVDADDPTLVSVHIDLTDEPGITLSSECTDGGIATDFAAAVLESNAFYGMIVTGATSPAQTAAAAALAEAGGKILIVLLPESDVPTSASDDAASDLETLAYHRTAGIATRHMSGYVNAGLMGRQFALDPGSSSYNWKTIPGAASDSWTLAQYNYIKGKTCGVYAKFAATGADPIGITQDVKAFSGRYLDITRGVDWLDASLAVAIANEQLQHERIPNNATGRALIQKAMSAVMKKGERFGLLEADTWTITIPTKAEQSAEDKASRALTEVKYTAVITGAIDTVTVAGTLTL